MLWNKSCVKIGLHLIELIEIYIFYFANSKASTIIDMGIAICHFHLTAIENNLKGEFKVIDSKKECKEFDYIISWIK